MIGYFNEAQKIIDADKHGGQVWISGSKFAENEQNIKKGGFILVLSCMETQFRFKSPNIQHLRFPIDESQDFDIKGYFQPAFETIQAARKSGKVLIYSNLGISRSSTILISYIMQKYNKKCKQVLQQIKLKRPCSQPTQNLLKQLQWYQKFKLN